MIREANRYDKDEIISMMKEFRDSADFIEVPGKVFYAEGKGLLMCVIMPTVWDDKMFALHELAWYVRFPYRGGTTGYRLFDEYIKYGKALKEAGRIKYFTMTKLDVSPDLDYARFGFRKKDENWIQ